MEIQTPSRKKSVLIGVGLIFVLVLGFVFFPKEPDVDTVVINKINKIQKELESEFNAQGISIAKEKEVLFARESEFNTEYGSLVAERNDLLKKVSDPQRLSESGITTWINPQDNYYTKDGVKKYIIQEAAIGGASAETSTVSSDEYTGPNSLYYTCLRKDNCYVTQSDTTHLARNGYLATDVGTNQSSVRVLAPDHQNNEIEYTAKYIAYGDTTGDTIELTGEDNGAKIMWRIGHVHWNYNGVDYKAKYDGKKVRTGTVLAWSGGEKEASARNGGNQGATTGRHVHIEYLQWDGVKFNPAPYRIKQNLNVHVEKSIVPSILPHATAAELPEQQKNCKTLTVTAYYSPVQGQSRYATGSFAGDKRLNGNGTNGASGIEVFDGMVAAPKTYAFGTKIQIEGKIYQVEDRGGAIVTAGNRNQKYDRIDIWMGKGEEGLSRATAWGKKNLEGCFIS